MSLFQFDAFPGSAPIVPHEAAAMIEQIRALVAEARESIGVHPEESGGATDAAYRDYDERFNEVAEQFLTDVEAIVGRAPA